MDGMIGFMMRLLMLKSSRLCVFDVVVVVIRRD